ncbi:MAG TPA: hypothetical protein VE754_01695 [Actinomycetota bacterium]|nr:hypothetical protein [Actinomycetota bacterium]
MNEWESLGGSFGGQPAACARDKDRIDVFAIGTDGTAYHRWWNGTEWVPWEELDGAPRNARAITCSWIGDRLDVFVWGDSPELSYVALRPSARRE